MQEIPLDAIVGSVGRYADFTRSFLPRSDDMEERWARVKTIATGAAGWPPIEVYRLGDVYFVLDGNHRVSVAREMGLETIPAFVTEVKTRVPVTPDDDPEEIIIQARRADFMERTGLNESRPEADLTVTAPGAYRVLDEHIQVHRYYMVWRSSATLAIPKQRHTGTTGLPPVAGSSASAGCCGVSDRTETDLPLAGRTPRRAGRGAGHAPAEAAEDLVTRESKRPRTLLARRQPFAGSGKPRGVEPARPPASGAASGWRARR